jgi:hypothetical protein
MAYNILGNAVGRIWPAIVNVWQTPVRRVEGHLLSSGPQCFNLLHMYHNLEHIVCRDRSNSASPNRLWRSDRCIGCTHICRHGHLSTSYKARRYWPCQSKGWDSVKAYAPLPTSTPIVHSKDGTDSLGLPSFLINLNLWKINVRLGLDGEAKGLRHVGSLTTTTTKDWNTYCCFQGICEIRKFPH